MNKPKISLDTNVIIFGLRKLDLYAGILRQHLFQFDVRMSAQVERELQKNLSADEFRQFYDLRINTEIISPTLRVFLSIFCVARRLYCPAMRPPRALKLPKNPSQFLGKLFRC